VAIRRLPSQGIKNPHGSLKSGAVRAALHYARERPLRGRPFWLTSGATIDMWPRQDLYWAIDRPYSAASVPGLDAYAFENFEAKSIKGIATVTRAGVGTVEQDGSIVSVAAGMPRVGDTGLVVEEARTNLVTYSSDFSNAAWTKGNTATLTKDATGPDGLLSATTLVDNSGGGTGAVNLTSNTFTVSTATAHTYSVYAKADQLTGLLILVNGWTTPGVVGYYFDLSAGTVDNAYAGGVGLSPSIEDAGNGWYRCILTFTSDATDTTGACLMYVADMSGSPTTTVDKDGTSSILLYGAQLEAGAFATSYIPTAGASVTRPADSVTIPTSLFDFSTTAGTVFFKGRVNNAASDTDYKRVVSINDGTANNEIYFGARLNLVRGFFTAGGVSQASFNSGTWDGTVGAAFAWEANNVGFSVDGSSPADDTSATTPTGITQIQILTSPSLNASGECEEFYYYSSRLTATQIDGLTAGTTDPATLSPALSLDFINRTYSRGGDPFAETVLSDDFTGYGSQAEAESAAQSTSDAAITFDASGDRWVCDGSQGVAFQYLQVVIPAVIGDAYQIDVAISSVSGGGVVYASEDGNVTRLVSDGYVSSSGTSKLVVIATQTTINMRVKFSGPATAGNIDSMTCKRVEAHLSGIDSTLGLSATETFNITYDDATTATQAAVGGELTLVATNNPLARVSA
jgi:hypothetical protein